MSTALILFAHGARDPEWARPLQAILASLQTQHPTLVARLAFLEFMSPTLEDSVTELVVAGARDIAVVPMFIAQGGHLKRELPLMIEALRASYPLLGLRLSTPVGEHPAVTAAMADAAMELAGLRLA